ncbi:MAG: CHAP domain-containing protein [Acidimicrobiales bacterium]
MVVGLVGAAGLVVPAGVAGAASAAGGSGATPPVPAGSSRAEATVPQVAGSQLYPGSGVVAFGDASVGGAPLAGLALNAPVVTMVTDRSGSAYWLAGADGGIYAVGGAPFYGSVGNLSLVGPVVGIAATPDDGGYWLVALDGGVFAFGDAGFYGSMGGQPLNEPIVGMAPTADGMGYWLVAADGGIFAFGDAAFYGSEGGVAVPGGIVAMTTTPDGKGYWLAGNDGSVYPFGDATSEGTLAKVPLNAGIAATASTPDGKGYWLLGADGGVFAFGDAGYYGSAADGPTAAPYLAIVPSPDGKGYLLLEPDAYQYSFANPPPAGGSPAIVASASSQVQPDPYTGYFCNPYGGCIEWCALFATWTWQQAGVPIPSYTFTGSIYDWSAAHGSVLPAVASPVPGDIVLYGSGPRDATTSLHAGVVAQVWPDGAIDTVEGDAGPGATGHLAVVVNGPFLPSAATWYGDYPVYAYAQP